MTTRLLLIAIVLCLTVPLGFTQEPAGAGKYGSGAITIFETSRGTYELSVEKTMIELNLIPANVRRFTYPPGGGRVRPDVSLLWPIPDLVGIVALKLAESPEVPKICWENREHQFWNGFEGSFEPRNVVVYNPVVQVSDNGKSITASYNYIANFVKTSVRMKFYPPPTKRYKMIWDTTIKVENLTGEKIENYLQFFASYHQPGTNYYWDISNEIRPCSKGGFNAVRDRAMIDRLKGTPYQTHIERYKGDSESVYEIYRRPVLLSGRLPWFDDGRHVIMVQPKTCAAIVTWREQARDYMITPEDLDLDPGEVFSSQVRHVITSVKNTEELQALWNEFEDHQSRQE